MTAPATSPFPSPRATGTSQGPVTDAVTAPEKPIHPSPAGVVRASPLGLFTRRSLLDFLPRLLALVLCLLALSAGWRLREWTFAQTAPVRFKGDIQNGLNHGGRVLGRTNIEPEKGKRIPFPAVYKSWVSIYDDFYKDGKQGTRYILDYTPLRLMVMTLWVREVWADAGKRVWGYNDAMAPPLMRFNAAIAATAAAAMFLLVRHWTRRAQTHRPRWKTAYATWRTGLHDAMALHKGWFLALLAALLVWFNAAALIDAHAFPQWDIWLLPFYLGAAYAASRNNWLTAGVLLILGAMLKGQIIIVAPLFPIWALFAPKRLPKPSKFHAFFGHTREFLFPRPAHHTPSRVTPHPTPRPIPRPPRRLRFPFTLPLNLPAFLRFLTGVALGVSLVTFPWLIRTKAATHWIAIAAGGFTLLSLARWALIRPRRLRAPHMPRWEKILMASLWWFALAIVATGTLAATCYPTPSFSIPAIITTTILSAVAITLLVIHPFKPLPYILAGTVAFGILLAGWQMGGSWSWFHIGFVSPTDQYQNLANGPTANLPALLQNAGWGLKEPFYNWKLPAVLGGGAVTLQLLLRGLFYLLLTPIALMLPWHARRNSPRTLLCLAAPWVLMFTLMPQMHERYLVWAAVVTSVGIAISPGLTLAHLATTTLAFACIGLQILNTNRAWWPQAHKFLQSAIPGGGWALIILSGVYLVACLTPPRKHRDV